MFISIYTPWLQSIIRLPPTFCFINFHIQCLMERAWSWKRNKSNGAHKTTEEGIPLLPRSRKCYLSDLPKQGKGKSTTTQNNNNDNKNNNNEHVDDIKCRAGNRKLAWGEKMEAEHFRRKGKQKRKKKIIQTNKKRQGVYFVSISSTIQPSLHLRTGCSQVGHSCQYIHKFLNPSVWHAGFYWILQLRKSFFHNHNIHQLFQA